MQISNHADMKSTKRGIFQQKIKNQSICDQISFGVQLQTFPWQCNTKKFQPKTWNIDKKTHSNNRGNYTHQNN